MVKSYLPSWRVMVKSYLPSWRVMVNPYLHSWWVTVRFWSILVHVAPFWSSVLPHFGPFWSVLFLVGPFWSISQPLAWRGGKPIPTLAWRGGKPIPTLAWRGGKPIPTLPVNHWWKRMLYLLSKLGTVRLFLRMSLGLRPRDILRKSLTVPRLDRKYISYPSNVFEKVFTY